MSSLRGAAAAVGIGLSKFGEVPNFSYLELMAQAVGRALADTGLRKSDIDGVFCVTSPHNVPVIGACEYLGIKPKVVEGTMLGGSSFINFLQWAALALDTGLCEVALITFGSDLCTGGGGLRIPDHPWERVYRPRNPPTSYALATARHMHQYGTTRAQLAEVAVAARAWARLNPAAMMQDPLSIEDVLAARIICDPLSLYDCCLVCDGAGAVILTKAERAKDFPRPPAYLLGVAADGYRVTRMLGYGLPPVIANKVQIQQVVVNLLRNSVEAMAGTTRREITITSSLDGDTAVKIAVSDTGPGLPDEVSSQLFKPFVTTKPDGMGVGLSICRAIIDDHGGRFEAAPNPGGGTIFSFTVPTASKRG